MRSETAAVERDAVREFRAAEFGDGGEEITEVGEVAVDLAGGRRARPRGYGAVEDAMREDTHAKRRHPRRTHVRSNRVDDARARPRRQCCERRRARRAAARERARRALKKLRN